MTRDASVKPPTPSVNAEARIVFVNYGRGSTSAATDVDDLTFLNGEKVTLP